MGNEEKAVGLFPAYINLLTSWCLCCEMDINQHFNNLLHFLCSMLRICLILISKG